MFNDYYYYYYYYFTASITLDLDFKFTRMGEILLGKLFLNLSYPVIRSKAI
jgi:hypothetical protein